MSTLTITTIQSSLFWEDPEANRRMFEEKILSVKEKMELVILPEAFTTGFSMHPSKIAEPMNGPTIEWMKRLSARKKIILTGSVFIEENGQFFNRLLWVLPNGQIGHYDKRHLFAYAGEDEHFTSGNRRFIGSVKGWRRYVMISGFPSGADSTLLSRPVIRNTIYSLRWQTGPNVETRLGKHYWPPGPLKIRPMLLVSTGWEMMETEFTTAEIP